LWVAIGIIDFHSNEEGKAHLTSRGRCDAKASQMRNKKKSTEKKERPAPIDETKFHLKKASG